MIHASAYVKVPGTGTTVYFAFRDANATHNVVVSGVPPVSNQWVRMAVTYTVPAGKVVDRVAVAYTGGVGTVWGRRP
ncbi:hypothetical protein [Streptomyces sp. DHE17-7]|uniref:hypothetical protein n=1 Tax=Streptomyces sp. DHE17-7 TaxID=2759949 RepID=UPI0022EAE274|nr:hypothetical protein [Streptomyces sp. DHE17-7]MBJ6623641.1 hypothetical protein [Streptomyces sp. DHE17-7]